MSKNRVMMAVNPTDKDWMMTEGKKLLLKAHPELEGMPLTHAYMFHQVLRYYAE